MRAKGFETVPDRLSDCPVLYPRISSRETVLVTVAFEHAPAIVADFPEGEFGHAGDGRPLSVNRSPNQIIKGYWADYCFASG